ncbi:hypothetical protein CLAFUW4_05935 [Fulvia fulva]|uniref:Uncharacterized protein n=1 Tax=Passalora fulva TaxID=5499 RepID=A0A9Q8LI06_PASFU|nr:uncharacterized protein CLAFUR5_06079 [Fulvia fulva]KAK4623791.1 hypothetical protein CLAFUR4_05940 [Fulvia fulva]KAK4625210.1 hypothetical protein CLAFUR0_05942 [Fulvia fulva]UJO17514.1 hypothetical protein CLAFUR5_06079 [Fulvia fulva]WPV15597.1 hypothetical protein CLAFUW4_05935 [Fulvia fulva]WPV29453.1 hypothetical protein CLAFUW7_05933 [Fulvia fulva]
MTLPKLHTGHQRNYSRLSRSPSGSSRTPTMSFRELPMPTVSRITCLAQAQATLQHCSTKLCRSWQNHPARVSPPGTPIDAGGQRQFQQWLDQWEQAFTTYLSYAMPAMKTDDVTTSRILKANHLSCTILASDSGPNFDNEFQAIVELAGAIEQSRTSRSGSASRSELPTEGNEPWSSSTLDIHEPLYVVVARCDRNSTRKRAMDLLANTSRR